ncbi:ATP-binding cassette domain-containing protein [Xanthobacter sp. V4C-4]|uniref:ABC transporter ATP-binding protein n=1 Tax=Xanthobacter cornucopiae TaxID=3119924 RepID=UPI0037274878
MLQLEGVRLTFADGAVLERIDLQVRPGELVVLIGRSGCGKTSLLRLAAGVQAPSAGVLRNGFGNAAMVFQDPRLLPWADARDNAGFGLKARGVARAARRAAAAGILARFGFTPGDLRKRPAALSGGMRQRVAIARALAVGPDLVLMDEPFSALDVGLRQELQALVRREVERAGTAVLFVTHDLAEAVRLADRIVVLSARPSRVVADLPHTPVSAPGDVYAAAAALMRRPEVAAALAGPTPAQPEAPAIAAAAVPLAAG